VRRIVSDITALHPRWRDLVYRYELVAVKARPDWGESPEQLELSRQIEAIAADISRYQSELEEVGCVFKGFEQGLVDFYGQIDGRDVFWCWKNGEEKIEYWHEIEAGYAGRQMIPETVRS
jgi:hypothetical protein